MKKITTLIAAFAAAVLFAHAQPGHNAMTFVGQSSFHVTMMGNTVGQTTQPTDTVLYAGADFTLPSMKYNDMIIPSFQITGTTFTGGYGGVTWNDQTFTSKATDASGNEKAITGTSLKGSFTHADGIYKLQLEVTFSYGAMPFPITYAIESYYVKDYAGENVVTVGGQFGPYKAQVTHKIRTYLEDGTKKMDVEIPTYSLEGTVMGDLTIGSYTVRGLTYDEEKGGFYRDYADDGLKTHFTAVSNGTTTMDADYALSAAGCENILVETTAGVTTLTNNFKPGNMPFPIAAVMTQGTPTGIEEVGTQSPQGNPTPYNLQGQRIKAGTRGLVIRNGRKYFVR